MKKERRSAILAEMIAAGQKRRITRTAFGGSWHYCMEDGVLYGPRFGFDPLTPSTMERLIEEKEVSACLDSEKRGPRAAAMNAEIADIVRSTGVAYRAQIDAIVAKHDTYACLVRIPDGACSCTAGGVFHRKGMVFIRNKHIFKCNKA